MRWARKPAGDRSGATAPDGLARVSTDARGIMDALRGQLSLTGFRHCLHLMAVHVSNYEALRSRSEEIAGWAASQTRAMATHYYLSSGWALLWSMTGPPIDSCCC